MENKSYLPYHESLIEFLGILENEVIELMAGEANFISRFRVEVGAVLGQLRITAIPEKEINFLAVRLLSFYTSFITRHKDLIAEESIEMEIDERGALEDYFLGAIKDLVER